jgi:hypothetical protein
MEIYAYVMDGEHVLMSVCTKSTLLVEASSARLHEPMFDCLPFVMQKQKRREELQVSRLSVLCLCSSWHL